MLLRGIRVGRHPETMTKLLVDRIIGKVLTNRQ